MLQDGQTVGTVSRKTRSAALATPCALFHKQFRLDQCLDHRRKHANSQNSHVLHEPGLECEKGALDSPTKYKIPDIEIGMIGEMVRRQRTYDFSVALVLLLRAV